MQKIILKNKTLSLLAIAIGGIAIVFSLISFWFLRDIQNHIKSSLVNVNSLNRIEDVEDKLPLVSISSDEDDEEW